MSRGIAGYLFRDDDSDDFSNSDSVPELASKKNYTNADFWPSHDSSSSVHSILFYYKLTLVYDICMYI